MGATGSMASGGLKPFGVVQAELESPREVQRRTRRFSPQRCLGDEIGTKSIFDREKLDFDREHLIFDVEKSFWATLVLAAFLWG